MNLSGDYYSKDRSELLDLMPSVAMAKILDIGCGAGRLGKTLKERGCESIYGIEPVVEAAQIAESIYDKVFISDIESAWKELPTDFFDIIICADVLEHLKDPWDILGKLKTSLRQDGSIVASIPNIRNGKVIGRLLQGEFGYDNEESWIKLTRDSLHLTES